MTHIRVCVFFHLIEQHSQVFVTYPTGALYVHPLWFYKHQHDNRVRSKLSVACQRWWFQWRFWFVPSVQGYLREEEEHKPDPWRNPIERNHEGLHLENEVAVVKTPTIISNNPVFLYHWSASMQCAYAMLSSASCPALPYFSTLSHKQHDFLIKKELLKTKHLVWLSLQIVWNISHSKEN